MKSLSRSEKIQKLTNDYSEKLKEAEITGEEYEYKMQKYIIEIKEKYRRIRKSKTQIIEEYKYEMIDKLSIEHPGLSEEELIEKVKPFVEEKRKELNSKTKKPRRRNKNKKLDARRQQFVKHYKESYPDASDEDIQRKLDEYTNMEGQLLEDDILFNRMIQDERKKMEKEMDTSPETLQKIKQIIVEQKVREKIEFFKGTQYNETDIKEASEMRRIMEMKESGKMDELINMAENVMNQQDKENTGKENMILNTKTDDELIEDYRKFEMNKPMSRKYLLKMRNKIINEEMKRRIIRIRREVEIMRKLKEERKQLEKELSSKKKYKNNKDDLNEEIEKRLKRRKESLNEYLETGIDPIEHDTISVNTANTIWNKIIDKVKENIYTWNSLKDKEKMEMFASKHIQFNTCYPIIMKKMILELLYNEQAFRRFLEKSRKNLPPANAKHAEREDIKLQNQAYYIQYLYEEQQRSKRSKGYIDKRISTKIFEDAYSKLRKEKRTFEERYKETKELLEKEKAENSKSILHDVLQNIRDGHDIANANSEVIDLLRTIKDMKKE